MISVETFSQLLEVLYAAPYQPECWEIFLTKLCEATGSCGAYVLAADKRRGLAVQMQGGLLLDSATLETYAGELAPEDPYRRAVLRLGKTGFFPGEELVPQAEFRTTAMYQQLIKPMGLEHLAALIIACTLDRFECISVWRTAEQGPMDDKFRELFELLEPHVRAVLDVRRTLGVVRQQLSGAKVIADASATATLLVRLNGELMHSNAAGKRLLEEADGLTLDEGRVCAELIASRNALGQLLEEASGALGRRPAKALLLERGSGRKPLQLMALPMSKMRDGNERRRNVMLLAIDPEKPTSIPEEALQAFYSLSPAEIEVVNGLLTGYSLEEIAVLRSVSVGTVRHQLKAVFGKTGTHGQPELVRAMMALPGNNLTS